MAGYLSRPVTAAVAYDAFISYSHAKDKPIATALQSVVQKLGKAWYRRRALRLFRDDASLTATPHLWPSIEQALSRSRFLILLASPEAAASRWVDQEIAYWLDHNSANTVFIALTEGELGWDDAAGDFLWSEMTPLPLALKNRFTTEPRWIDLRARLGLRLDPVATKASPAGAELAATAAQSDWRLVLRGHEQYVQSASFSPDGSHIVTASWDKTARIWDAATAAEIAVLRGHDNVVWSAGFSPDGSRIVTASQDKTARIWDTATAKEIAVLRGHGDFVVSAAFSPDGSRIVTASGDKTARIWDAGTAREVAVLSGHAAYVMFAAFNSDGSRIVTTSSDETARIWDTATAKEIAVMRGHEGFVRSAAFSPDASRIVTASYDKTARSAPMGRTSSPLQGTIQRGFGTPRRQRRSPCCAGTKNL
jgi:predicted oxidoreductase (fatty acid repression mutant protein)